MKIDPPFPSNNSDEAESLLFLSILSLRCRWSCILRACDCATDCVARMWTVLHLGQPRCSYFHHKSRAGLHGQVVFFYSGTSVFLRVSRRVVDLPAE